MDKKSFYDAIRKSLHNGFISNQAVKTYEDIIQEAATNNVAAAELAYIMATSIHEVGPGLEPKRESLNYSVSALTKNFSRARISAADASKLGRQGKEPAVPMPRQRQIANLIYGGEWGKKNLGNTQPNDGWEFRGGGLAQVTGRANFAKAGKIVGVDLVANPGRITETNVAVKALVIGMIKGIYTGKKLADYVLPAEYRAARYIINADVVKNGDKIANDATVYLKALTAAKYAPAPEPVIKIGAPAAPNKPVDTHDDTKGIAVASGIVVTLMMGLVAMWGYMAAKLCGWFTLFCGG